ncbi:hypothetical protein GSI_03193 [Ganoderma sinense ZZ0214-1]|uniref:Uncharacterized protein n=1 Tax=Ganoderma sinense ZZ0214-1 TaxID=1077348 RepID=A0A2G8SLG5_9APHY|nr:hypothetical protein GSI_03193 [Ganoderma sinense ZZ0214-1]
MRLLDTRTGHFVEKDPKNSEFKYAILSHTWDANGEQTYKELKKIQKRYAIEAARRGSAGPPFGAIWEDGYLSPKILKACRVAREHGYRYIWIDSCCIDQTSSSELSEAINCMYAWYKGAHVCYAYLADVPSLDSEDPKEDGSAFRESRWFKRGWTLQELLAPRNLIFLSQDWRPLGWKKELADLVSAITGISVNVLARGQTLSTFSVAQRLSWAARRETTRVEDRAYSLLGIFDINMPTLYGEGECAFQRLEEEILRRIPDQSIFAWGHVYLGPQIPVLDNLNPGPTQFGRKAPQGCRKSFRFTALPSTSLLSQSPDNFVDCGSVEVVPLSPLLYHYPDLPVPDYNFTPHGIRTHFPLIPLSALLPNSGAEHYAGRPSWYYLAILGCEHSGRDRPGHLLGRVCYLDPSATGIRFLSRAFIEIRSFGQEGNVTVDSRAGRAQLVALSAEALLRSSALAKIDAVHLYHPDPSSTTMFSDWDLFSRPHKGINLMLKRKPHALPEAYPGSRTVGSSVKEHAITLNLRFPDQDHPATHWLTVTRSTVRDTPEVHVQARDAITIEYTHALELGGRRLTIVARIHGTLQGYPIIPITITWIDEPPWGWHGNGCMKQGCQWKDRELVTLYNGDGCTAEMVLSVEFLAANYYVIDAHTEWCRECPQIEENSDSESEEGYFTADEDDQVT